MADIGDGKLLDELTSIVPHRDMSDAVWAERFVGPVRAGAIALGVGLLIASVAVGSTASVVGFGLAVVALAVPWTTSLFIRPVALGLDGDEVLVFTSHRWRRKPIALTDVVAAASIDLDFPGVFSDAWRVGSYRVGIARTKRARLRSWCTNAAAGTSPAADRSAHSPMF